MTKSKREEVLNRATFEIGMGVMNLGMCVRNDRTKYGKEQADRIEKNVLALLNLIRELERRVEWGEEPCEINEAK